MSRSYFTDKRKCDIILCILGFVSSLLVNACALVDACKSAGALEALCDDLKYVAGYLAATEGCRVFGQPGCRGGEKENLEEN